MFIQNFIELSLRFASYLGYREKNSDEHTAVRRYGADSNI